MDCALDTPLPRTPTVPWEPPAPEHVAALLPQYEIEALIGRGGMGAVYKGRQVSLNRTVALKILPAELSADREFITRFQREAQTLASLSHNGIVTIFDFGTTTEGHLYFVMEYIDGTDLAHALHTQRLEPDQALELTMQICEALHYAHSQGVVHRDIKPGNVLIGRDGRAKLADFGLARPLSPERTQLTASNVVMGSPDYMAPEQWQGKADHRADIYALGVMLYEMLTGTRPQGAFDLPSIKSNVDARLDAVVIKAMRQEPDRRYQRVSELRHDVDQIRTTRPPQPFNPQAAMPRPRPPAPPAQVSKPAPRSSFETFTWGVVALLITGLVFGAYTLLNQAPRKAAASPEPLVPTRPAPSPPPVVVIPPPAPKPEPVIVSPPTPPAPTPPPTAELAPACIEVLKAQAVNAKEWALAPLDESVPNDIRQNLTLLREDLVDEGKAKPRAPIAAYSAAWHLCNALLAALDERDKSRIAAGYRAAQANANQSNTSQTLEARRNYQMSWPQHAREQAQRSEVQRQSGNQTAVADQAQKVAWATRTETLRGNLDKLYAQFRAALR
jgi:serine/threonine protein kinase